MAMYGVSITVSFYEWDATNNVPKTGDAANIANTWTKDGTKSATTNSCSEVDATNDPGQYKLTLTSTEASCLFGTLHGKSSTSGCYVMPLGIAFEYIPNAAAGASGGLPTVDASNQVKANATALLGTAWLTPTVAGTPDVNTVKVNNTAQTAADLGGLLGNGTYGLSALEVLVAAIKTVTDKFVFTVSNKVDANALDVGGTAQTGADLGALLTNGGYGLSALETLLNAINGKTTNLPSDPASESLIIAATNALVADIAALNNLSQAQAQTAATAALTAFGVALQSTLSALHNLSSADVTAAVPTASQIATTVQSSTDSSVLPEAYATQGSAGTLPQLLYMILALLSDFSIAGTTLTATKLDGSTPAATFTLNDATAPTSITRAT